MNKLNESSMIKIFQRKLGNKKFVPEDVEIFKFDKTKIVVKTDTLVQSTDIPSKMNLIDAARKSVIACISDFAAKGVKPSYGIVSVNIPNTISRSKINDIANGFKKACDEYDILILGGDTNEGKEIVFNVCIFGKTDSIVNRKGSKNGDIIFVTGPFGYSSAGLRIILDKIKVKKNFMKKAMKSILKPKPKLNFGLKNKKYFSASMDSSDGLSTTLHEMSKQSKKKFIINNIPTMKDVEHFANYQKLDLNTLVFHGGEEYEFVFTVPPKYIHIIKKNAILLKTPIIEIGHVVSGKGVFVERENKQIRLKDLGWKHFR